LYNEVAFKIGAILTEKDAELTQKGYDDWAIESPARAAANAIA